MVKDASGNAGNRNFRKLHAFRPNRAIFFILHSTSHEVVKVREELLVVNVAMHVVRIMPRTAPPQPKGNDVLKHPWEVIPCTAAPCTHLAPERPGEYMRTALQGLPEAHVRALGSV